MKVETNVVQKVNVKVQADAEVFIIPNHTGRLDLRYWGSLSRAEYAKRVCKLNGIDDFDYREDKFVEIWWVSNDLHSDNISSHGVTIPLEDELHPDIRIYSCDTHCMGFLPSKLFQDLKEGQSKKIIIPINVSEGDDNSEMDIEIEFTITAAQTKYRYARFGNFEDVLKYVNE